MRTDLFEVATAAARPVDERERRLLLRVLALGAIPVVLIVIAWVLGVFAPKLDMPSSGSTADGNRMTVRIDTTNRGVLAERLVSLEAETSWFAVERAWFEPEVLEPGATGQLVIEVAIDCGIDYFYPQPVRLTVARPWGDVTTELDDYLSSMFAFETNSVCG